MSVKWRLTMDLVRIIPLGFNQQSLPHMLFWVLLFIISVIILLVTHHTCVQRLLHPRFCSIRFENYLCWVQIFITISNFRVISSFLMAVGYLCLLLIITLVQRECWMLTAYYVMIRNLSMFPSFYVFPILSLFFILLYKMRNSSP